MHLKVVQEFTGRKLLTWLTAFDASIRQSLPVNFARHGVHLDGSTALCATQVSFRAGSCHFPSFQRQHGRLPAIAEYGHADGVVAGWPEALRQALAVVREDFEHGMVQENAKPQRLARLQRKRGFLSEDSASRIDGIGRLKQAPAAIADSRVER